MLTPLDDPLPVLYDGRVLTLLEPLPELYDGRVLTLEEDPRPPLYEEYLPELLYPEL